MARVGAFLIVLLLAVRLLMCRVPVLPGVVGVPVWGFAVLAELGAVAAMTIYLIRHGKSAFRVAWWAAS